MDAVHGGCTSNCVQVLDIPAGYGNKAEVVEYEADVIAKTIQSAIANPGDDSTAEAGDFLIISTRKQHLPIYARRLTEQGIPCEVTGGAILNEVNELGLLCLCLETITQPDNPVALVAVLRSQLFGISDDALYAFKRTGGRFSFHATMTNGLSSEFSEPLEYAFGCLQRYGLWLKRLPPVAAIE